ncbi:MAG TPA: hypothetical protein VMZ91_09685 [Candidatus Paceibacterota bacterium]|nr:hypothetical protein [Candidatus Paceibacterota bacterium]
MVLVTDIQFYMNKHLRSNLKEIPRFLRKGYDCVIIVTGHGKVRVGKSTIAQQVGYYAAWLMAGGKKKPKKKKVPFNNSNIVFTPDGLVNIAQRLPKKSVIVYDEGRAGLDSIRAMENINKGMMDFFQECGQYQHVIIIVLPNYFRLSEDIAIPRSLFLIDVYHDSKYNRGYFKFYNEIQKEYLYVFGKKKLGTYAKYNSANPSFSGKFTNTHPNIDVESYDNEKRESFKKKQIKNQVTQKTIAQLHRVLYHLHMMGYSVRKISLISGLSKTTVAEIIRSFGDTKENKGIVEERNVSVEDRVEPPISTPLIAPPSV